MFIQNFRTRADHKQFQQKQNETTVSNLMDQSRHNYQSEMKHQKLSHSQKSSSENNNQRKKYSLNNNESSDASSQLSKLPQFDTRCSTKQFSNMAQAQQSIVLWKSLVPSQISNKFFKAKYSSMLLSKKHISKLKNKKYEFQMPQKIQKYCYQLPDFYKKDRALHGITIGVHVNSLLILSDIIVSLFLFTLSSFEGLFTQFTQYEAKKTSVKALNIFCLTFLIIRNIIQCFKITTYHSKLIFRMKDILKHRFTQFIFLVDLSIIIVLFFQIEYEQIQGIGILLYFLTLTKCLAMTKNIYILQKIYLDSFKQLMWWNIFRMFVFNLFFAHFFATMLISLHFISEKKNWITKFKIDKEPWYIIYIWAYYWAAGVMNSLGFGDIVPAVFQEALSLALLKICTLSICVLIDVVRMEAILELTLALVKSIGILRAQADKDKISYKIRQKIQNYLIKADKDKINSTHQQKFQFLKSLPKKLQIKYIQQFNKSILRKLPFFTLLTKKTLFQISIRFYEHIYYPKDYILPSAKGRPDKITILKKGNISFTYKKFLSELNGTAVHNLEVDCFNSKKNTPFLVDNFFLNKTSNPNYDIRADTFCKVLHLDLNNFYQVIQKIQLDRDFLFQIFHRHQIFIDEWCQIDCQYCFKRRHTLFQCPKIHYMPFRDIIVLKSTQPDIFKRYNSRNIIYHRKRSKFRQKQRRNPFFMKPLFNFMQNRLKIKEVKRFNQLIKIYSSKTQQQKNNQYSSFLRSQKVISLCQKQSINLPQSLQFIQIDEDKTQYFEKEYLYKRHRQVIDFSEQKNNFRYLKIRIFDLITQQLQPQLHGFWDLQIDKLYNFKRYFRQQNSQNFNHQPIQSIKKIRK